MARLKQHPEQQESPQVVHEKSATEFYGGDAPSNLDVMKSAYARARKRHEVKDDPYADMNVLPDSSALQGDERVGIRTEGYLVKKGIRPGTDKFFNSLPPGMHIEDQETADIREMPYGRVLELAGTGYEDLGAWDAGSEENPALRPDE